jgi:hypothetical protein
MQVLTDSERARLIDALSSAPDEILCNAVRDMNERQDHILQSYRRVTQPKSRDVDGPAPGPGPYDRMINAVEALTEATETYVPKPIEVPPGEACTRVGGDVKTAILKALSQGPLSASEINALIKRGPAQVDATTSTLKLLWVRGDIVFESGNYKIKPKVTL